LVNCRGHAENSSCHYERSEESPYVAQDKLRVAVVWSLLGGDESFKVSALSGAFGKIARLDGYSFGEDDYKCQNEDKPSTSTPTYSFRD